MKLEFFANVYDKHYEKMDIRNIILWILSVSQIFLYVACCSITLICLHVRICMRKDTKVIQFDKGNKRQ